MKLTVITYKDSLFHIRNWREIIHFFTNFISCFLLPILLVSLIFINTRCNSDFDILLDDKSVAEDTSENNEDPVIEKQQTFFWSEIDGSIQKICTNGTGQKIILTLNGEPLDIALNLPGNKLYWTEFTGTKYQINKAGIDGSGAELFYESNTDFAKGPTAIAIDSENNYIYWNKHNSIPEANDIWRADLAGLVIEKWINNISKPYTYSICLDAINRKIYFTANYYWYINTAFGSGSLGHGYFGDLDTPDTESSPLTGTGPADPSMPFLGIAVDSTEGNIFYVSNTVTSLSIKKADLSLQNEVEWITSNGFDIQKIALDLNERKIYWTSGNDNSIYRADIDIQNSNVEIFLHLTSIPTGIAIAQ